MENTIEEIKIKYSRVKGKINPYDFNVVCKMSTSYESNRDLVLVYYPKIRIIIHTKQSYL